MKFIKTFDSYTYNSESQDEDYEKLMGKLLRLYNSIPLTKNKAKIVIQKILNKYTENKLKIGENVIFNYDEYSNGIKLDMRDKIRFQDYFNSIINDKNTRGFNFEGTIAGIFNGRISTINDSRYDVIIDEKYYSVKFIDSIKPPELGSFKDVLLDFLKHDENNYYKQFFEGENSITLREFFSKSNDIDKKLKSKLWYYITGYGGNNTSYIESIKNNNIQKSKLDLDKYKVDYWLIAFPRKEIKILNKKKVKIDRIYINIISNDDMPTLLETPVSPKAGKLSKYSLALSSTSLKTSSTENVESAEIVKSSYIEMPLFLTKNELDRELDNSWAKDVFGDYAYYRIRPDVLRYIEINKEQIIKKFKKFASVNKD